MGDAPPPSGTSNASSSNGAVASPESNAEPTQPYVAYRPSGSEYTPPASPQARNANEALALRKNLRGSRSRHPANLQMDASGASAFDRPLYSPSPSASPPLPPLPSPLFPPRQRAPSLLRLAATSSPLNEGHPPADQPAGSPTFRPRSRKGSAPGAPNDPRTLFNPLASNPIGHSGPAWRLSRDESAENALSRARGMTSSSQPGPSAPHHQLRAATSIPDYGQYRGTERSNLSGAYRPNRGGANWSHNEAYPMRPFRPDESRASFRSGFTNASSSFVDASGTERSSMATGRSSMMSDSRTSVCSTDPALDRNDSRDSAPSFEDTERDDEDIMSVEDVIDSYCYDDDDDDDVPQDHSADELSRLSPTHAGASDSEAPALSQTNSQSDRDSSHLPLDRYATHDSPQFNERSYIQTHDDAEVQQSQFNQHIFDSVPKLVKSDGTYMAPPQLSPLQVQLSPLTIPNLEEIQRDSALETRQPVSPISPASGNLSPVSPLTNIQPFRDIQRDLSGLPKLPQNKSRLSRQDWADIASYAKRTSRWLPEDSDVTNIAASKRRPALAVHVPQPKESSPLPEVDEDDAYPRRASTSVFDRRSTLFDLTRALSSSPPSATQLKTDDLANESSLTPRGKRQSGQTLAKPSPISQTSSSQKLSTSSNKQSYSPPPRDRYGFKKATDKITAQQYDAWYDNYGQYVSRRRNKWISLLEKEKLSTSDPVIFPNTSEKVRRYARKGYPPEWRGAMWWFYSGGERKLKEMTGVYSSLVWRVAQGELNRDDAEAIERDLDRTFPDNIHFRPDPNPAEPEAKPEEEPAIVQDLRQVLQCFALNNPGIGYCQSLNFIAGLLLLFMKQDTEKVFILLTIITQHHLPGAHARSLANTEVNVLMMLIKEYLPKVWSSINDTDLINNGAGSHAHPDSKFQRQPTVALSCTSWFMSLFVGVLPIEVVLRVWDAFLYEGPRALYRYALAIFKLGEPEIRKFHPGDGELFMTVQNLPRKCLDPNILHDLAFVKRGFGSLSQNVIDQKRMFWQQQLAREKSYKQKRQLGGRNTPATGLASVKTEAILPEKKGTGVLRRKASRRFLRREKGEKS